MKLYYSPGACSLADHIALIEWGVPFEIERVDLQTRRTETGADFVAINPKGYVPALVIEGGETITENIAVLDWIATQYPALGLEGPMGRTRLIQTLAYISTEVHKSFKPLFHGNDAAAMAEARQLVTKRLELPASRFKGPYLFGARPTVADCYLFVMLLWSKKFGITVPAALLPFAASMVSRPAVQKAMEREGLHVPLAGAA